MSDVDVYAELLRDNPREKRVDLMVYADALRVYCEASLSVRDLGAVCIHPKTGAPMENPYLKVQVQAGRTLRDMPDVNGARVMALLLGEEHPAADDEVLDNFDDDPDDVEVADVPSPRQRFGFTALDGDG